MRIMAGVGAWLFGAGTATAGSLLAVSLLGQGIADSPGQQLTAAAVNQALARETHETSQAATAPPRPSVRRSRTARPVAARSAPIQPVPTSPAPSATPAPPQPAAASPQAAAGTVLTGTVLTSPGGTVLAECRLAGAYLVSWSPTQGYQAAGVARGPAVNARVVFNSAANSVTMVVSCPDGTAGAPVATSYMHASGVGRTDE